MAITATLFDSYTDTTAFTDTFSTTNSKTPTANVVYRVGLARNAATALSVTPTLTGWGITWGSPVARIVWAGAGIRELATYEGITVSPSTGVLTFTFTGDPVTTGQSVIVVELGGDIDTADPVVGTPVTTTTTGTSATITHGSYVKTSNAALAWFMANLNSATNMTPDTDWTEVADVAHATPSMHLQCQFRADAAAIPDLTCTAAWDATNLIYAAIMEELSATAGRTTRNIRAWPLGISLGRGLGMPG